jgi:hypothetical protein
VSGRRRTGWLVAVVLCLPLAAAGGRAAPPLLRNVVRYPEPASRTISVYHSLQHVRGDSLDLVRHSPAYARVSRLEAHVVTETHAVYARQADPERYRIRLLPGAPTDWTFDAELGAGADAPCALGPDYVCVWLGAALVLPEHLPAAQGAPVVTLMVDVPPGWPTFLPWQSQGGAAAVDLDGVARDFVAAGAWRTYGRMLDGTTPACSLVTCIAGDWPVSDEAWEKLALAIHKPAPGHERALVCIAPLPAGSTAQPPPAPKARLWRAAASTLLLCPADPDAVNRTLSLDVEERRLVPE